jgi:hypothetical protein
LSATVAELMSVGEVQLVTTAGVVNVSVVAEAVAGAITAAASIAVATIPPRAPRICRYVPFSLPESQDTGGMYTLALAGHEAG